MSEVPFPPSGSVQSGRVVGIKPFGAFIEMSGFRTHGLVHISQLAPSRVEAVEDVVRVGQDVLVKVLSVEAGKVSLSMKAVDQSTGADLGGSDRVARRGGGDDDTSHMTWGKAGDGEGDDQETYELAELAPKIEPNFETTGKLAEATNKVNGVVLKWSEPQDARRPTKHWRLYVFKGASPEEIGRSEPAPIPVFGTARREGSARAVVLAEHACLADEIARVHD